MATKKVLVAKYDDVRKLALNLTEADRVALRKVLSESLPQPRVYRELSYDIPVTREQDRTRLCRRLRRVAIRSEESTWVMRADHTPWNLLNELTENGMRWHTVRFHPEDEQEVLKILQESLTNQVQEQLVRLQASIDAAQQTYNDGDQTERRLSAYQTSIRASLKRSQDLLNDLTEAAQTFGFDLGQLPMASAGREVDRLRTASHSRAMLYARMVQAARGTSMQVAAEESSVPGAILRDFLIDQGGEQAEVADDVGDVFNID
jgi:hypothetical protein